MLVLGRPHGLVHGVQPMLRVGQVGRQCGQHHRHLVAVRALLVPGANRDRNGRDERCGRQRIVKLQPSTQRPGTQGHDNIVDGQAFSVIAPAQALHLCQRQVGERPPAVRGQWCVERCGRSTQPCLGQQICAVPPCQTVCEWGADSVGNQRDRTHQDCGNPDGLQRLKCQGDCAPRKQPRGVRGLLTLEVLDRRQLATLRGHVQQSGQYVAS